MTPTLQEKLQALLKEHDAIIQHVPNFGMMLREGSGAWFTLTPQEYIDHRNIIIVNPNTKQ